MTDKFLHAFMSAELDAGQFSHKDHVYAAWLMLHSLPTDQAAKTYAVCLRNLAAKFGVPEKFHATVTQALMLIIADRLDPGQSWNEFWAGNPDLGCDAMGLLETYYSRDLLFSDAARREFILPDLRQLPPQSAGDQSSPHASCAP